MKGTVNQVTIIGRLGKDAKIVDIQGGKSVAKMSVATEESYKDKEGNWVKKADWVPVQWWSPDCAPGLVKGAIVVVTGKVTTNSWEKDGVKQYDVHVQASAVRLVAPEGAAREDDNDAQEFAQPTRTQAFAPRSFAGR